MGQAQMTCGPMVLAEGAWQDCKPHLGIVGEIPACDPERDCGPCTRSDTIKVDIRTILEEGSAQVPMEGADALGRGSQLALLRYALERRPEYQDTAARLAEEAHHVNFARGAQQVPAARTHYTSPPREPTPVRKAPVEAEEDDIAQDMLREVAGAVRAGVRTRENAYARFTDAELQELKLQRLKSVNLSASAHAAHFSGSAAAAAKHPDALPDAYRDEILDATTPPRSRTPPPTPVILPAGKEGAAEPPAPPPAPPKRWGLAPGVPMRGAARALAAVRSWSPMRSRTPSPQGSPRSQPRSPTPLRSRRNSPMGARIAACRREAPAA